MAVERVLVTVDMTSACVCVWGLLDGLTWKDWNFRVMKLGENNWVLVRIPIRIRYQ